MLQTLSYPFDAKALLAQKKKLRRLLLSEPGADRIKKKVAVLGGSTTHDIVLMLELFLLNEGIEPEFYESEYNQYYQDAMFPNDTLLDFKPDFIYIHTTVRNVTRMPALTDAPDDIDALLAAEMEKYTSMWERLSETFGCTIIQNNFDPPIFRLLGNKDASDPHGAVNFVNRLNTAFADYARLHEHFYLCDINYLAADIGLRIWADPQSWYLYKYALGLPAIPHLAFQVSNIIKSLLGRNKKGYVLDLDNTLWGGVIGDDGVDGIELGPEEAVGQAYLDFQRYLKAHKQLGVLLNVDSKNDEKNALAGLRHPDGALTDDDMIVIKANWEPKDQNFISIAEELELLPESLVFVDDNPAERHIISAGLPGVAVPDIGEAQDNIRILDRAGYFEVTTLSADDSSRHQMYKENAARTKLAAQFTDYNDYLLSLDMKAVIAPFSPLVMPRIAQLTNKSNQFNLTTRRYTTDEIERIAADPGYITLYGRLRDRFGDNGVVSVAIGRLEGRVCHIDLWLMSCRVLKRNMEYAMMDSFITHCRDLGVETVIGHYRPTAKNGMVREFYAQQGFEKINEDAEGNTVWSRSVNGYQNKNAVIAIEEEQA